MDCTIFMRESCPLLFSECPESWRLSKSAKSYSVWHPTTKPEEQKSHLILKNDPRHQEIKDPICTHTYM